MKIYPYLRNYFFLLLASQAVNSALFVAMAYGSSMAINSFRGEPIEVSIFDFQFLIISIVNFFVMIFIKTDFDRHEIKAPWVLALTIFNSMAGIAISWLILYLSNHKNEANEHREIL